MGYYQLTTLANEELLTVNFINSRSRIFDYFICNKGDGKFLNFTKLQVNTSPNLSKKDILQTDYLNAPIGVPIFSKHFIDCTCNQLKDDLEFHEIYFNIHEKKYIFYLGKIKRYIDDIVDKKNSSFLNSTDSSIKTLTHPIYNKELSNDIYCARDSEFNHIYIFTSSFIKLITTNKLLIGFFKLS